MGAASSAAARAVPEPCTLLVPCAAASAAPRYDSDTEASRVESMPRKGALFDDDDCSEEISSCSTMDPKDDIRRHSARAITFHRQNLFDAHTRARLQALYRVEHILGEGTCGNVYEAVDITESAGSSVAVKCFACSQPPQADVSAQAQELEGKKRSFEKERSVLARLEHPHIVKMFEAFEEPDRCWIVMELCRGGELYGRIADTVQATGRGLDEDTGRLLFRQALLAVGYLHASSIVHRDVKTENLLLVGPPGSREHATVKLCDFGAAAQLTPEQPRAMDPSGTLSYTAPEVYHRRGAALPADVWSLGVVLYATLVGASPFRGTGGGESTQDVVDRVACGRYDTTRPAWGQLSGSARRLVSQLIVVDERARLPCGQAARDAWVAPQPAARRALADMAVERLAPDALTEEDLRQHAQKFLFLASHFARLDVVQQLLLVSSAHLAADAELCDAQAAPVWRELFLALDADGDGRIGIQEFVLGMKALLGSRVGFPDERLLRLAQAIDLDASGAIEWAEWMAIALVASETLGQERCRAVVRALDRPTGDGALDAADLVALLGPAAAGGDAEGAAQRAVGGAVARWGAGRSGTVAAMAVLPPPSRRRPAVGIAAALSSGDVQRALRAARGVAASPRHGRWLSPESSPASSAVESTFSVGRSSTNRNVTWFGCCQDNDEDLLASIQEEWTFADSLASDVAGQRPTPL